MDDYNYASVTGQGVQLRGSQDVTVANVQLRGSQDVTVANVQPSAAARM